MTVPIALLFDIDGTLIDSAGAGGGALLQALREEFDLPEVNGFSLHGRTDLGIVKELLNKHGVEFTEEHFSRLCSRYFRLLPDELRRRSQGRVLPGVKKILEQVSQWEHVLCGLLTGNMPTSARSKLEHFDLWHFFDFGIYGDQVAERPALSSLALHAVEKRAGQPLAPERIVVVGDTPLDVRLAHAMGARCLAVETGGFDAGQLQDEGADWVVADLSDTQSILAWCLATK